MIALHRGVLVNRFADEEEKEDHLNSGLKRIYIEKDEALYAEKIAIGSFSPLKGFMNKDDPLSVCIFGTSDEKHPGVKSLFENFKLI